MPAPTPARHTPQLLCFLRVEMIARTHRGEYRLSFVRDASEYNGRAYAHFHGYEGYCESVKPPIIGAEREVVAACDLHAAAQPVWPPLLGWPADGDLEATLALEARHG